MKSCSHLLALFFLSIGLALPAQNLVDDFESGSLSNWNILQGNAESVNAPVFNGSFAARLHKPDLPPDAQSLVLHNSFSDNWGIYEMQCFANGAVSDVQFLFQYLDGNNYYAISCNPQATDNPELHLYKLVNGNFQTLASVPPTFVLNSWFQLRIERYCDGRLQVFINGQREIDVVDNDLSLPGSIAMAAWGESSYFDDIFFTSVRDEQITELEENICSGTFFTFGNNQYSRSGTYIDTLPARDGCDSIIRLALTVHPHFLVTEYDTICADTFYVFGSDTLTNTGRFNRSLKSRFDCDSIVELNLSVFGGDTIIEQINLCTGGFTLFNGDTLRSSGSYFQTVTAEIGCTNIIQLDLVIDQPSLNLGPDITVCFDETPAVLKEASGFDQVEWSDSTLGEVLMITRPGTYWARALLGSCVVSDTFIVNEECIPMVDNLYFIPNAFSPNGDGKNDHFRVETSVTPENFRMHIFNRWGSLIFQTENTGSSWDGTSDGRDLPPDVYLYLIEFDGKQSTGDVTLVR